MRDAIACADAPTAVGQRLHAYFDMAAEAMRNRDEPWRRSRATIE
jgi:hypothetical protein